MRINWSNFDWVSVFLYVLLVFFGWVNICSASSANTEIISFFDLSHFYGKQALWIGLGIVMIIMLLSLDAKFFERFSGLIYILAILSLVLVLIIGQKISGARSWFSFGGMSIQPSEFVKAATALALAKYVGDLNTNITRFNHQLRAFFIIGLPAFLILLQPDAGSALVFSALLFSLYREGVTGIYFFVGFLAIGLFVATLYLGAFYVCIGVFLVQLLVYYFSNKKSKTRMFFVAAFMVMAAYVYSVSYVFYNVFEQHHRDRIHVVLGLKKDSRGIGYNTIQSEIAIGSGGWWGRGWQQGTQTRGGFVPEQHTDYIFSAVGEEWGFIGSAATVIVFIALILRIIYVSERQKTQFNRVYGYSIASIFFVHFFVNIGMVIGLLPTVGIPLPFFSYGGSGLWAFTILLFIFLKLDLHRLD